MRLKALAHLCENPWDGFRDDDEQFVNASLFKMIEEMAPNLNDTFRECRWKGDLRNCSDLFVPLLTEAGLCFSFNALNWNEIYSDK